MCSNLEIVLIAERNRREENCKLVANLLIHPEVDDRVAAGVGQGQPQEDSVDIAHSSGGQSGQGPKQQLGNKHYTMKVNCKVITSLTQPMFIGK